MELHIPEPDILTVCSSEIQEKLHVNIDAVKVSGNTHTHDPGIFAKLKWLYKVGYATRTEMQHLTPEAMPEVNMLTGDPGIFAKFISCASEVKVYDPDRDIDGVCDCGIERLDFCNMFREVGHDKFYEFKYGADFLIVYDPGKDGDKSHSFILKYIGAVFNCGIDIGKVIVMMDKLELHGYASSFTVIEGDMLIKHLDSPAIVIIKKGIGDYFACSPKNFGSSSKFKVKQDLEMLKVAEELSIYLICNAMRAKEYDPDEVIRGKAFAMLTGMIQFEFTRICELQFTANSGHVIKNLKEGNSRLYLSLSCSRLHLRLGPAKSETVKTDLAVIVYENKEVLKGHLMVYTRP